MVQELNSGLLDSIPSPTVGLRAPGPTTAQLSPTMRFCRAMNSVRMRKRLRKVLDLILATDALVGSLEDASLD